VFEFYPYDGGVISPCISLVHRDPYVYHNLFIMIKHLILHHSEVSSVWAGDPSYVSRRYYRHFS
jgi:hypothetical protein